MLSSRNDMFSTICWGLVLLLSIRSAIDLKVDSDPDVGLTVMEIIEARGYTVEEHKVVTADRYVLTMYRLPQSHEESQSGAAKVNKPAVLLQHGLLDSSYTFVCNFRNQSLAYVLADAGYDVWLGNNRGSTWSREHLDLSADVGKEYWDFTWEDMGKYDLPAEIDYVLNTTGRPTLSFVGHSEGNIQAFVGFSTDQELAKKVSFFAALAPAVWMSNMAAEVFSSLVWLRLDKALQLLGYVEFSSRSELVQETLAGFWCTLLPGVCNSIVNFVAGPSISTNATRMPVYISQSPAGTSVKNIAHFAQSIREHTFASYDYGCDCDRASDIESCSTLECKNKEAYGSLAPPEFPITSMKYPRTGFFRGSADTVITSTDVDELRATLPSGTLVHDLEIEDFSHLDLSWAYNANSKLYQNLIAQFRRFEGVEYD